MLMEASGEKLLTLSELIRRGRPLCGASSLPSSTNRGVPAPDSREEPSLDDSSPTPKILKPLNHPVVLVGSLILPVYDYNADSSSTSVVKCRSSNGACFRFSDDTSTLCCDVLHFEVPMLGQKIRVLAFNFIPFKHGGGFLEIIKWCFISLRLGGVRPCSSIASFPLSTGAASAFEDSAKARYNILGAVESVSPVFTVPCSGGTESNGRNLRGFIVEFMTCNCQLCESKGPVKELVNISVESHSYSRAVFVYFCGSTSPWHPAMTKLIGRVVVLSGLKKKMMFIGKEESQLMFVVTEKTLLHMLRMMPRNWTNPVKTSIRGEGECGHYSGIIRAVYMQGMVVELDKEVWLLLTDQQLVLPHSIRIGAIIAVKNAHFVRAKFVFTEVLILGCCFKSSIIVESFSPLETGCHVISQTQGLLGNFIASLVFSARLWMLLAISCFRKKFAGILPENEILGSKRKEGLSQLYARSCLPSWATRSRHGVFSEVCKHASASCGGDSRPYDGELILVVPLSAVILYCEDMWFRMLQGLGRACRELYMSDHSNCRLHGEGTYSRSARRIIPSREVGINLFGTLMISPASGRLQLVDATGSIDVLVPDLPPTWKPNSIYEVTEYTLIIEGIPQRTWGHLKERQRYSFSCKRILSCSTLPSEMNVEIVIYFHFRHIMCRDFFPRSCDVSKDEPEELNGKFHMLQVVHKFPMLQKFPGDPVISDRSSAFVEAVALPWNLFLAGKDRDKNFSEAGEILSNNSEEVCRKRRKTDKISWIPNAGSLDDVSILALDIDACLISSSNGQTSGPTDIDCHKIPCMASVRNTNKIVLASSGILYSRKGEAKTDSGCRSSVRKIMIEFKSSNLFQYQGLQIGGYYIVKHHSKSPFSTFLDSDYSSGSKILFTSETKLRSLSIFSSDNLFDNVSSCNARLGDSHFKNSDIIQGDEMRIPVKASAGYSSGIFSDVYLHICRELLDPLESELREIQSHFIKLASTLEEVNLSSSNENGVSLSLPSFKRSGFGSPFPVGNLVCIRGEVLSLNIFESHESLSNGNWSRNCHEDTASVSIHVLMGNHAVEIYGYWRKHACPIGFGQGVNATFYRILKLSVQNRFMLTPISFIEIDSMRIVNDAYLHDHGNACCTYDRSVASDIISPALISELAPSSGSSMTRLRCRVADVGILILESDSQSKSMASPPFDIPIAAFIVEDGSSSCVCWANGKQASSLVRLSEKLPRTLLGSRYWTSRWIHGQNNTCGSNAYYVQRILKKHGSITMKNYGSIPDSCEDLAFSVSSENLLSNSDENLLRSVIVNACLSKDWIIIGNLMDSAAARRLQNEYLLHADMKWDCLHHIWAREVHSSDPLREAKSIIEELQRTGNSSKE